MYRCQINSMDQVRPPESMQRNRIPWLEVGQDLTYSKIEFILNFNQKCKT